MRPVVSVCIPARNHGGFLGEAIASALGQDGVALEVLVHDDASSDGTARAVAAFRSDERVRYVRHPAPRGVARNRDSCLHAARGHYVAWLDADDSYLPGMLARQVELLDREPGVGIVHGGSQVMDERGARLPDWPPLLERDSIEPSARAFEHLIATNEITTSTVVARRACHEAAGGFGAHREASSSDWAAWLRVALRSDVAYTAAPVARYRQHSGTISAATAPSGRRLRADVAVVRALLRDEGAPIPDRARGREIALAGLAAKALAHAGDLFTRGHRHASARAVALAVRLAPRPLRRLAPGMIASTLRGDAYGCYRGNRAMLGCLAKPLDGTRHGARLRATAATDPAWESTLERAAAAVRRVVPEDGCVGAVTKWDPTLLALSGRRGLNFPDRAALPDGYPRDGRTAVAHLESLQAGGLSHLVFPSNSFWWLDHYPDLAEHLESRSRRLWEDDDCVVFELGAGGSR